MRLLLDTHIALWWIGGALADPIRELVGSPENAVFVSAVSIWEIAIKNGLPRRGGGIGMSARDVAVEFIRAEFTWLPVSPHHGFVVEDLPLHHNDPFDRMLVAQAISEDCRLVTHDKTLAAYGESVMLV